MSPTALALSLALAASLDDLGPANDNGSRPIARPATSSGLAVGRSREHVASIDAEYTRETTDEGDRQVHAPLDALNRRSVDANALGQLSLAPLLPDPKLPRP
jgi:hypothetical protein